jgi:hypothetical protein
MNAKDADDLGAGVAALVHEGRPEQGHALLAPVLAERTPFRLLDRIGKAVGTGPLAETNIFLDRIAAERTEGGWVVIASALREQWAHDPDGAFARCHDYVVAADVWYATDILGERVPGPALASDFDVALALLAPWREDTDRWVRRTVGVAVHFWAKRSRGTPDLAARAEVLLAFLAPMFEERDMDAVKGVGWGLKTLGRHYPDLVADWLAGQASRRPRALMLRKALTYLPAEQRIIATGT